MVSEPAELLLDVDFIDSSDVGKFLLLRRRRANRRHAVVDGKANHWPHRAVAKGICDVPPRVYHSSPMTSAMPKAKSSPAMKPNTNRLILVG